MGMTLKELLTKGEGTLSAQEAKALAAQCRMDVDTLYTLLEERGIKILEEENEPSLDVDSIIAEVENAENNNDDMGLADENEEDAEENPADLKAAMDELLDDPVKNYLKQIGQIPLLSAEQAGNQLETQIMIALVLGGMPVNGGAKVRFYNIILGVMTYKVLSSGLVMLMMPTQLQQLILGIIFLIEVAIFSDRKTGMIVK